MTNTTPTPDNGRPFDELRDSGFLWLINRVVFHPRGYALALHYDGDATNRGDCTGWSLMGDGSEPWAFGAPPEPWPEGYVSEDELFERTKRALK